MLSSDFRGLFEESSECCFGVSDVQVDVHIGARLHRVIHAGTLTFSADEQPHLRVPRVRGPSADLALARRSRRRSCCGRRFARSLEQCEELLRPARSLRHHALRVLLDADRVFFEMLVSVFTSAVVHRICSLLQRIDIKSEQVRAPWAVRQHNAWVGDAAIIKFGIRQVRVDPHVKSGRSG